MRILVLAENKEYAGVLMKEFFRDNLRHIVHYEKYELQFSDSTVMRFDSVKATRESLYHQHYDQIFTTEGVCSYLGGKRLGSIAAVALSHSSIPQEFQITILDE